MLLDKSRSNAVIPDAGMLPGTLLILDPVEGRFVPGMGGAAAVGLDVPGPYGKLSVDGNLL
jgi:hypothetical protein